MMMLNGQGQGRECVEQTAGQCEVVVVDEHVGGTWGTLLNMIMVWWH